MNAIFKLAGVWMAGCILGTPLLAATYKWVDEKGAVHYSQTPPDNRRYETLRNPPSVKDAPVAQDRAEPAPSPPPAGDKASREKECEEARTRLATLEKNAGRLVVKQEDGSMHRLSEEERLNYIKDTTKNIDALCR